MTNMPREKELYRDFMQDLNEAFPDKLYLNITEVMKFTGMSRNFCTKRYTFEKGYITKRKLASELS